MELRTAYLATLGAVLVVATGVGYRVVRRNRTGAGVWFAVTSGEIGAFAGGAILQALVADPDLKVLAFQARQVVGVAVAFTWFVFVAHYTGREGELGRRVWAALVASYLGSAALVVTNHHHQLVWEYAFPAEPFYRLAPRPVVLYWAIAAVMLLFVAGGLVLLATYARTARRISRRQVAVVGVATLPAVLLTLLGPSGALGLPRDLDYNAVSLGIGTVVVAWALFSAALFDVEPLSRDAIVRFVDDALVAVDRNGNLVDYNEAAAELFPDVEAGVGDPVTATLPELVEGHGCGSGGPTSGEGGEGGDAGSEAGSDGTGDRQGGGDAGSESGSTGDGSPADPADPLAADGSVDADRFVDELELFVGGDRRVFTVASSPLAVGDGVRGYILALREVTEQREYARKLERQTEQLDRFAGTLSHDLRNPLTVAQLHLELVDGVEEDRDLRQVGAALDRMERLIDDALTLAREGQAIEDREFVGLASLAREAWETSDTADATLVVDLPSELRVYADGDRLYRALENLFRNAVDHGHDDVTVTVGALDGGFFVADDGPGIPPERRESVFEEGVTTAEDGTGLGLAIVESIVEAHGWSVRVTESADGGARFEVTGVDVDTGTDHRGDDGAAPDGGRGDPGDG